MERNTCRPDVLLFVVVSYFDVVAARLQLMMLHLAKDLKVGREEQLEATLLQVVVPVSHQHQNQLTRAHACTRTCTRTGLAAILQVNLTVQRQCR